ncbi:MAG: protein kinase [Deltaproteobacteria bacterium]|nr:protein kinase [Deltaproteobacteria bacterium]
MAEASHNRAHGRVGTVVRGKYKVDAFLATGTMANVYSATHRNGSRVALKILHKELANDQGLRERFKREGYFANSIGHPGVVRAIDDDTTEDGCAFLVMELLEGETLEERRRRKGGKLPLHQVLSVADALLEVLAAAHAKDVVHRDMKPDNVFVTKTGEVKVLDFGVARWADGKKSSDMTAVGMVLGTPAYMPPEQALGRREEVDAQSDIWAVGATLFVVLSGESVHEGGDAKAKLIATARTPARPIQEVVADIPRSVAAVIDRALAFDKKKRWPDAYAMREALRWARMSLENDPARDTSSQHGDFVPPPVPTRRNMDDEPTMAGMAATGAAAAAAAILESMPPSHDVVTSAPPITLRDGPKAHSPSIEPVFSLRRTKDGEEPPATDPVPGKSSGLAALVHDQDAPPKVKTLPGIADPGASAPPPSPLAVPPEIASSGANAHVEGAAKSVEVNLSFTRPMAALVMPDFPSPRPAAGEPPPPAPPPQAPAASPPAGVPIEAGPPPQAATPPPPANAFAATALASNTYPTIPPQQGSNPPNAHLGSMPPPNAAYGPPPTPGAVYTSAPPQATLSGAPDAPGPVLAQIVDRRSNVARIVIALMLGCALLALVLVVVKRRAAAAAAAAAAAKPAVVAAAEPSPGGAGTTTSSTNAPGPTPTGATVTPSESGTTGATPTTTPTSPTSTASASASVAAVKKPPRKRKPKPPAATSATASAAAPAEPTATGETPETPPAAPPEPTPPSTPPPAPPEPTSAPTE